VACIPLKRRTPRKPRIGGSSKPKALYRERRGVNGDRRVLHDLRSRSHAFKRPGFAIVRGGHSRFSEWAQTPPFYWSFVCCSRCHLPKTIDCHHLVESTAKKALLHASGPEMRPSTIAPASFEDLGGLGKAGALTGEGAPEHVKLGCDSSHRILGRGRRWDACSSRAREGTGARRSWRFPVDGLWLVPGVMAPTPTSLDGSAPNGRPHPRSLASCPGIKKYFPRRLPAFRRKWNAFVPFIPISQSDPPAQSYLRVMGRLHDGVTIPRGTAGNGDHRSAASLEIHDIADPSLGLQSLASGRTWFGNPRPALLALWADRYGAWIA